MNDYQKQLFEDLMILCEDEIHDGSFYFVDTVMNNSTYRIFNYRLSSYEQFLYPSALECRGVMYKLGKYNTPEALLSLPFQKFFNRFENPMTMDLDFSNDNVYSIDTKADGSLISSYKIGDEIYLKSKGSVQSEQAIDSLLWLLEYNKPLYDDIVYLEELGNTVIMEWTSPTNRIVLSYSEPSLIVLGVRSRIDGSYINKDELSGLNVTSLLESYTTSIEIDDTNKFIDSIPDMEHIEGYVVTLNDGMRVKVKTNWYILLHRSKDDINSPKKLMSCVINETTDDLKSLFHDDPLTLKIITDMEELVIPKFNNMVETVKQYHEDNKHLDRKTYAIQSKNLDDGLMSLYMNAYTGKENNFKEFSLKHFEMFIGELL